MSIQHLSSPFATGLIAALQRLHYGRFLAVLVLHVRIRVEVRRLFLYDTHKLANCSQTNGGTRLICLHAGLLLRR